MDVSLTAWVALIVGLVALLLLDLFVIHRDATVVSIRDAAWSTAGFIAVTNEDPEELILFADLGATLVGDEGGELDLPLSRPHAS